MTKVAIQGIRGSYSEEAAVRFIGESVEFIECSDFGEVFRKAGSTDCLAVVPLENSVTGSIAATKLLLAEGQLAVRDELTLDVRHVLAAAPGVRFDDVETVRSHPQALMQCKRFFLEHPRLLPAEGPDTASSIRDVIAENATRTAVICSRRAAEMYGAAVLRTDVADSPDNRTTFFLLGK